VAALESVGTAKRGLKIAGLVDPRHAAKLRDDILGEEEENRVFLGVAFPDCCP